jgi:hypothetical protein
MKKFIGYFNDFHRSYFHLGMFAAVLLFIASLIGFNYSFPFKGSFIHKALGVNYRLFVYLFFQALAYYGVLLIVWLFNRNKIQNTTQFWLKSLLGLVIIGLDRSFVSFVGQQLLAGVPVKTYVFFFKVMANLNGFITVFLPLLIMKLVFDRKSGEGLYGLRFHKVDWKAYFVLLLLMVPVLFCATLLPAILHYYPTYKRVGGALFANYYQLNEWVSVLIYETAYLSDFLNTELFYRGFLIIGLSKLLGKNVVLPMVAAYAAIHFGKPLGETISSVFGGYILGVIALYSRNIWGGVFLHGGIAFFMEVFAYWRQ